jgi:hypothetical protein
LSFVVAGFAIVCSADILREEEVKRV